MIDLEHLQQWVGRTRIAQDVVTPEQVRRFAATLDLRDVDCSAGSVAPRLFHFCLAPTVVYPSELGPDGHPARGDFMPPVPLPRRMWAGGRIVFNGDLRVCDTVRRVSRIDAVTLKRGGSGDLCFVTLTHSLEADGAQRIMEQQDIVYRGAAGDGTSPPSEPAVGQVSRAIDLNPTLLFRYSALTFNGHRIHYDRRYCIEVESYPGLVVHGPLQATLLFHQAAALRGDPPDRFSFRSHLPLFDEDNASIHSVDEQDRLVLWTARNGGAVAMRAEAEWL